MNRKATSITALFAAAAVAVAPVSGAVAATSAPAAPAPAAAVTPAAVLKNIAAAPAGSVGSIVVVTDEAATGAAAARSASPVALVAPSVSSAPFALSASEAEIAAAPAIPASVTDALNLIGLPVQAVFGVVQRANGVYTVWYKLLSTVPQAIWRGEFGSVPKIFSKAVDDSITWITTGAGPAETVADAAKKAVSGAAAPNPITAALDVAGIPVAAAFAAGQAGLSIYQSFYGLLTSVPQALWQGTFGEVPTLVFDAVTKSIKTIVDFPGAQIKAATTKIEALIASLTPASTVASLTTTADTLSLASPSSTADAVSSRIASTVGSDAKAGDTTKLEVEPEVKPDVKPEVKPDVKPEVKPEAEAKPVVSESKPVVEETKPAVDNARPTSADAKPASTPADAKPASTPADAKPAESASATEKVTDDKPAAQTSASEK